jgi:DNA-binding CsgD family transcriptional regulator
MSVLLVRGDELVMESSYAAVRELFWEAVRDGSRGAAELFGGAAGLARPVFEADVPGPVDADRPASVLHGLYWLTANLAALQPRVLLVDDAHWLDRASARFFRYLARRVDSLPVLLAVAARRGEGSGGGLTDGLTELASVLSPTPLSRDATAVLVRQALGARADEELCRACFDAAAGNPFYLRELIGALKAEPAEPSLAVAERVRRLGGAAVGWTVQARVARLGRDCERVADALAVLAPGAPLRQVALLAGIDRKAAILAADRLRAADVVVAAPELSFVHPIVREAIAAELTPSRRAAMHLEAARLLAAEGVQRDRVAAHLLSAEPFGEAWVVEALRLAAGEALAQGAPEAAFSYLRRALQEPPRPDERIDVLVELGRAEALLPVDQTFAAFREALELENDRARRAEIALELAMALASVGRYCELAQLLEATLETAAELPVELRGRIEWVLVGAGAPCLRASKGLRARTGSLLDRAERGEIDDPFVLAALAESWGVAGLSARRVARLSRRALADARLLEFLVAYTGAAVVLAWADEFEEAARAQDAAVAEAQRRGSAPLFMHLSTFRAETALRAGDLRVAEAHLQPAVQAGGELGAGNFGIVFLIPVLLERGRVEEAREAVSSVALSEEALSSWQGVVVLAHRGRVQVTLGDLGQGVADLLEADRRMRAGGCQLSVLCDWVPATAAALARLGRREQAAALVSRELEEARAFGAPRRLGMALSTQGVLDPGEQGLESLAEAVALLERSPARLEHARALVNLGTGLRDRGRPEQAREPLARGLDLADRCGAVALAEHAHSELVAAGARPRRRVLSGPESLTPAELRAARLAAEGLSNREIAQALFITAKTVEWQLTHVYAKLNITGRGELAPAFAGAERVTELA